MQRSTTYTNNRLDEDIKTIQIDAKDKILGRLCTQIADTLRGKNKPNFAPHQMIGEKVIVINAQLVKVTGNKLENKKYYRHSGYLGGIKEESLKNLLARRPEEVIRRAVAGMLPKNRLQDIWLKNLTIYAQNKSGDK